MAAPLRLEIQGSTNFSFDVEGSFIPSWEHVWNDAADPPTLAALRAVWEIQGARILADDAESWWDEFNAFMARFEDRSAVPTYARIVRDPSGSATVERTLGPPNYQEFRIENITLRSDDDVPDASFVATGMVDIRLSAVRVFADDNSITKFDQSITSSYRNGLQTLEWRFRVKTAEGTDVTTLIGDDLFTIPISQYGASYLYDTNGPDGVDWEIDDADEVASPARTPTSATVISRIKQYGIQTSVNTPGQGPNDVQYSVETVNEVGPDNGPITTITYRASAEGPNALAFVQTQKPTQPFVYERIFDERALRRAEAEWRYRSIDPPEKQTPDQLTVVITGGHQALEYVPITGNQPPRLAVGPISPFQAEVSIALSFVGDSPGVGDMKFPPELGTPWRLMPNRSREDALPRLVERANDSNQDRWERSATLIYQSPTLPGTSTLAALRGEGSVTSYLLKQRTLA